VAETVVPTREDGDLADGGRQQPRQIRAVSGRADRIFRVAISCAGVTVLAITGAVGLFLSLRAFQALKVAGFTFLTTQQWEPDVHKFGIAAVLTGTITIAIVGIVVATPISTGTALFITEVAPPKLKRVMISVVDLMAAVPSVVYGLWGFFFFQGHALGVARWISTWLGWIPIFKVSGADPTNPLGNNSVYTASAFIAGCIVGLMISPIQCAVMRDVFSQAPAGEREGAYALGSTRWGMIRAVVLPFGRGGIIGGTMLALGRALGETVAVYLIISLEYKIKFHVLEKGTISVSSLIATRYSDSSALGLSALFAAGLALFTLTLIVNFTASIVVARSRSGAQSEV
jgi:phosphate transport system permease protein